MLQNLVRFTSDMLRALQRFLETIRDGLQRWLQSIQGFAHRLARVVCDAVATLYRCLKQLVLTVGEVGVYLLKLGLFFLPGVFSVTFYCFGGHAGFLIAGSLWVSLVLTVGVFYRPGRGGGAGDSPAGPAQAGRPLRAGHYFGAAGLAIVLSVSVLFARGRYLQRIETARAGSLLVQRDYQGAIVKARHVLAIGQRSPHARWILASALISRGETAQGLEECRRALRDAPGHAGLHHTLVEGLLLAERVEEAVAHARRALREIPQTRDNRLLTRKLEIIASFARTRARVVPRPEPPPGFSYSNGELVLHLKGSRE